MYIRIPFVGSLYAHRSTSTARVAAEVLSGHCGRELLLAVGRRRFYLTPWRTLRAELQASPRPPQGA